MFCAFTIKAQVNFVPNPSFEDTTGVINQALMHMNHVSNWYDPTGATPDYYNDDFGTTSNPPFYYFVGRTGKSFAGFYTNAPTFDPNFREYLQVRLNQPLVAGKSYAVGYYYYYAGNSITNSLGFRFSYDTLSYPSWLSPPPTTYYNHLGTNSLSYMDTNLTFVTAISAGGDTNAWYSLQTTYTAIGGEEYLTIGNLYGADSTALIYVTTPSIPISQTVCYYLIDDVYVLDIEQLQDTDLVYIDTFNMGNPLDTTATYIPLPINTKAKTLLQVSDVLGRKSKPKPNAPLFYRYDDGTVEKRIIIE